MKIIRQYSKFVASFLLIVFLNSVFGDRLFAITGGASMPEASSFSSASTGGMVDPYTGSFSYNLPLINMPNGAPIVLTYNSNDVGPESLASWVGLGWNINPGSINRLKKGFPDEYNMEKVTYYNRMEANWTIGVRGKAAIEAFGNELGVDAGTSFNNYNGLSASASVTGSLMGVFNINGFINNGTFGFNYDVNPAQILLYDTEELSDFQRALVANYASNFQMFSKAKIISMPSAINEYHGFMVDGAFDFGVNGLPVPVSIETGNSFHYARQKNVEEISKDVCGSIYSYKAYPLEGEVTDYDPRNIKMDYTKELDNHFYLRDNFMGYPVSMQDSYAISGGNFAGRFSLRSGKYGFYRPSRTICDEEKINLGADVKIPTIIPIPPLPIVLTNVEPTYGGDLSIGYHRTEIKDFDFYDEISILGVINTGIEDSFDQDFPDYVSFRDNNSYPNSNESTYYSFNNEASGYIYYGQDLSDDSPIRMDENKSELQYEDAGYSFQDYRSEGKNKKRISYINTTTIEDHNLDIEGYKYEAFEKNLQVVQENGNVVSYNYENDSYPKESVVEYATKDANGNTYVYGLPVFSKNEIDLSYHYVEGDCELVEPIVQIDDNVIDVLDEESKRKIGTEAKTPYVSSNMLTQVLGRDYIDRTGDGPTIDDFGSYTRYNYQTLYGQQTDSKAWYASRSPFVGMYYNIGTLSSDRDNMASLSYVEKEAYYMHSISTKTHVAFFILDQEDRKDGYSAETLGNNGHQEILESSGDDNKKLKSLDRIELYAINDCQEVSNSGVYEPVVGATPIQTVEFSYDYSLCSGIENSIDGSGKLTLKDITYKFNGIDQEFNPYHFDYEYPQAISSDLSGSENLEQYYKDIINELYNMYPTVGSNDKENPDYNSQNADRWGCYRDFAELQNTYQDLAYFWPFVNQTATHDPAAWCLKQIDMPSGNSILIQYEANEYQFVQDKPATVMVPLKSNVTATDESGNIDDKKYYLDLSKLGIDENDYLDEISREQLLDQVFYPMHERKERMYFNFLYRMVEGNTDEINVCHNSSEYVEGFSYIKGYGWDENGGAYFTFKNEIDDNQGQSFYKMIENHPDIITYEMPRKVCKEFFNTRRKGLVTGELEVGDSESEEESTIKSLIQWFYGNASAYSGVNGGCSEMKPEMSFVRVQMPFGIAKKGGGKRVKRILVYDSGVDPNSMANTPVLSGSEFEYSTNCPVVGYENMSISSGVATNEPANGTKENVLYQAYDKVGDRVRGEAISTGMNNYSQEGIVGESFYPAPSIGYSNVITRDINRTRSRNPVMENTFYTAYDFPMKVDATVVKKNPEVQLNLSTMDALPVTFSFSTEERTASQGYSFVRYNMEGRPKHKTIYSAAEDRIISSEKYKYFGKEDNVPVMGDDFQQSNVSFEEFGKEVELYSENKRVIDWGIDASGSFDLTGGFTTLLFGVVPIPATIPYATGISNAISQAVADMSQEGGETDWGGGLSYQSTILNTIVTTKVVDYPVLLKDVEVVENGIDISHKNLCYDINTGESVISSYQDEFGGYYTDQTFKAAWEYENLKSAYLNEELIIKSTDDLSFSISDNVLSINGDLDLDQLVMGDFLALHESGKVYLAHVFSIDELNNTVTLAKSQYSNTLPTAPSAIEVVRSGRQTRLNDQMGSILYHNALGISNGLSALEFEENVQLSQELTQELVNIDDSYEHTFTGNYVLNLSQYADQIICSDPSFNIYNVEVTNVIVRFSINNNQNLLVELMSLDYLCSGQSQTFSN